MSGEINSPGSRSGIVGTTELDYETGTWTPQFRGSLGTVNSTTTVNNANYTKIGNIVHYWCYVAWTAQGTSSGNAQLHGFPFTALDQCSFGSVPFVCNVNFLGGTNLGGYLGGTSINFREINDDGDCVSLAISAFDNTSNQIMIQGSYRVS